MKHFACILVIVWSTAALALPGEDHWSSGDGAAPTGVYAEALQLIEAERFADALPLLTTLAEEQPGNADVFNLLGYAYRKTGDLERSGPAYARALRLDPYHRGALEYQGELFLMQGTPEKAEANLKRLKAVCRDGCEELEELEEAIATWRETHGE